MIAIRVRYLSRWTEIGLNVYVPIPTYRNNNVFEQLFVFYAGNHRFQEFTYFKSNPAHVYYSAHIRLQTSQDHLSYFQLPTTQSLFITFYVAPTKCKFSNNNTGVRE